jgi:outer membrane protein assembly factor BamB
MKQPKILLLIVIALLPLTLVSCVPWGTQAGGGWSGTAFHDGNIYAGTSNGRVVAINSSTQSLEWFYTVAMPSGGASCGQSSVSAPIYATPIVDGDLVYIGTYSGEVYALSRADGESIWIYPPKGEGYIGAVVGSPVIANGIIYTSSSDGKVYALNTTNGKPMWETDHPLADKLWTSPTVMGDTLYVSTLDGDIYALSAETGELLDWSFESEAGFASSPVICEDTDTMFLGSFDRHLYAVKIGSNVSEWRFPEKPAGNWFWTSPVIDEGIVYAGCLDGKLYAIEADTGREIWSYLTEDQNGKPSPIVSSPVLMDNLLIVVNESGTLHVFDLAGELANEGVPWWTTSIGAGVWSSFCAQEGLVYIRGEDNHLYIVDTGNRQVNQPIPLTDEA